MIDNSIVDIFSTGKQICLYTYVNPDLLNLAAKHSLDEYNDIIPNNESNDYTDLDISDLFTDD